LKVGSLESEKIGSLESEKIGSGESEKAGQVHTGYLTFSLKKPVIIITIATKCCSTRMQQSITIFLPGFSGSPPWAVNWKKDKLGK